VSYWLGDVPYKRVCDSLLLTVEYMYSVSSEAPPGSPGMPALLDAPTPQWEDISDAGLEMMYNLLFGN